MNENTKIEEIQKPTAVNVISTPMNLLELAVTSGADISKLEKLMELKDRWDKEQARKAFYEAMSKFQAECPIIKKKKDGSRTKEGVVTFKYAPIEDMVEQTKELIGSNGFCFTLDTPLTLEDGVEVKIKVSHIAGHSEITTVKMPFIKENNLLSPPQVIGATMSYAKRYAFGNAFGIITGDDDTDCITTSLVDEYEEIVKDWKHKELYITPLVDTVQRKSVLRQVVMNLPYQEQTQTFIKLMESVPWDKHTKFWVAFQKQTNQTADKFISDIKNQLTKEK